MPSTVPIHRTIWPTEWGQAPEVLIELERAALSEIQRHATLYISATIVLLLLLAVRPMLRSRLRAMRDRVARPLTDSYDLTLLCLLYTVLLAVPWPGLLWFLSWRLSTAGEFVGGTVFEIAVASGEGLDISARFLFAALLIWHMCRRGGLAEAHFRWDRHALRLVRRNLMWFIPVMVPMTMVLMTTEARFPDSPWRDSIGRLTLLAGLVAFSLVQQRLLRPTRGVFANWINRHPDSWLSRSRYVWFIALVAIPLVLAAAAAAGYQYTAVTLTLRLTRTAAILVGLLVLHALLTRALLVAQRRLAVEQARKKRAALAEPKPADSVGGEPPLQIEESELNLVTIGAQTRQLLRAVIVFAVVVGVWLTWSDMLPALSFMRDIRLWSYTVSGLEAGAEEGTSVAVTTVRHITLEHVALALLIAIATVVLAKNIPGLLEITLLQRMRIDAGVRFAATALARYTLTALGVILAFNAIGIGWSKVQWLVAAVSVGLGFGLQEIFANFVSGLVLLFERPIRIGDTVTVGEVSGTVTRMHIRSTVITDWDRKELVIPNKEFIVGQVINWTLTDPILRVTVPVGIAYGSDTKLAEETLRRVAGDEPLVLEEPPPRVLFLGFGDSSLGFELRVYINSIDHLLQVRHELHMAVDREFRKAGIEIAFPQRDIHVKSIQTALPVGVDLISSQGDKASR
jgi:potassium efflux system protein